ncbi:C40 family peptidase [Novilysobacter spongiicola]|uniref:C40 family peptidase n=1 Tax=Novilysobacter spongiicola TaxID=435289 RepID=UPI000999D056|nr:C40 family peptidase [Lysobacter spongiicola]
MGLPSAAGAAKLAAVTTTAAHYPGNTAPAPVRHRAARASLLLALACALAACGGGSSVRGDAPASPRGWATLPPGDPAAANAVLMRAISLVGTPYLYGGNTPQSGFDCSGLVNYVYRDMLDLKLPRTSTELSRFQGPRIEPRQLSPADLVFFGSGGRVTHVGIYVGEGRFVHAPSSGGTVRLDHLDGHYWRDHYSGAKRVL